MPIFYFSLGVQSFALLIVVYLLYQLVELSKKLLSILLDELKDK